MRTVGSGIRAIEGKQGEEIIMVVGLFSEVRESDDCFGVISSFLKETVLVAVRRGEVFLRLPRTFDVVVDVCVL